MKELLCASKDLTFTENNVHIKSAVSEENKEEIKGLAKELMK